MQIKLVVTTKQELQLEKCLKNSVKLSRVSKVLMTLPTVTKMSFPITVGES